MHEDRRQATPVVRERETTQVPTGIPVVRIKVRIDFYPIEGELDYSVVAWSQPGGALLANVVWGTYDQWHRHLAPADIVAILIEHLRCEPDPFP